MCFPRLWEQSEALHGWVLRADSDIGGSDFALISRASSSVREWDLVSARFVRGSVLHASGAYSQIQCCHALDKE